MYNDQNSVNSMAFPFMRKWLEDVWAIYHTRIYLLNQNGIQDTAETFVDLNDNGTWDAAEPFEDFNGNEVLDPEYDEFEKALLEFSTRTRRFGDKSNFSL